MLSRYQVAIVGGGPVGLGLAVTLGLRGISCAVIEKKTEISRIPKGQNLTQRTLEHFANWGIERELRAARLMPKGYPIGELTAYGDLLSKYWHAPAGRELVRSFYAQDNERLPQYQMERVLRERVASLPSVEAFFGCEAVSFTQNADGVSLEVRIADGDRKSTIACDYLVGCDGAHSIVRSHLGITQSKQDYEKTMLLAVFQSADLNERLSRYPERSTYRVLRPELEGYWQFFGRIDVPNGWFFHAPVPAEAQLATFDSLALIQQAAGFPCRCEFENLSFWKMRVAVADSYQAGRMFIAGDAAHSHPPYGGFGLNNGLEDVVNLGWKLAARIEGWGSDRLLESYGVERRPIFWETANDFITSRIKRDAAFLDRYDPNIDCAEFETAWKARETDIGSRFEQYEPNYEGSPVVFGPPGGVNSAHGIHAAKARPGHHLAPCLLSSGQSSFDALGQGFTLFSFGDGERPASLFQRAATSMAIPLKVIHDSSAECRSAYEADLILVRPDQYVVWAGKDSSTPAERILERVTARE